MNTEAKWIENELKNHSSLLWLLFPLPSLPDLDIIFEIIDSAYLGAKDSMSHNALFMLSSSFT